MKGAYFFIAFFLLFTSAMFLIPISMFPGDTVLRMVSSTTFEYTPFLSALINGIVYSLVAWAIFMFAMRKIGKTSSTDSAKNS